MLIIFQFIPGIMAGIEWDYEDDIVIVDLLILRVVFIYNVKGRPGI